MGVALHEGESENQRFANAYDPMATNDEASGELSIEEFVAKFVLAEQICR